MTDLNFTLDPVSTYNTSGPPEMDISIGKWY